MRHSWLSVLLPWLPVLHSWLAVPDARLRTLRFSKNSCFGLWKPWGSKGKARLMAGLSHTAPIDFRLASGDGQYKKNRSGGRYGSKALGDPPIRLASLGSVFAQACFSAFSKGALLPCGRKSGNNAGPSGSPWESAFPRLAKGLEREQHET